MAKLFKMNKTYEIVTEESAEHGDFEESGFEYEDNEFSFMELVREIKDAGATMPSDSSPSMHTWYSTPDADIDYHTGEYTYYSFHPKGLTERQAKVLYRLVTAR